jgi:NDP-sugar pyrophosphorylase family protein
MKAMIFAAGLGTRLGSATTNTPKALVKINGQSLLEIAINRLHKFGFNQIIINVHHHAEQIIDFVEKYSGDARLYISDEREKLLDTGGGLFKAASFFENEKAFLVYNADILCTLDLRMLYNYHIENKGLATLVVRHRETARQLLFDNKNQLCGWINTKTKEQILSRSCNTTKHLAFSGIHIISPEIFNTYQTQANLPFSTTKMYLELSEQHPIIAFNDPHSHWLDVGKPETLKEAKENFNIFIP